MRVEQQYLSHYWQGSLLPWTQNIQLGKYLLIWEKLYADIHELRMCLHLETWSQELLRVRQ